MSIFAYTMSWQYVTGLNMLSIGAFAQADLLKALDDSLGANPAEHYVTGTFKATHIINLQTVEAPAHGDLNFVIQHNDKQLGQRWYLFWI
jgi:hypothetical protein